MTGERRTAVVVVLLLLGAAGIGVAAGALMSSDPTPGRSTSAALGAAAGSTGTASAGPTPAAPTGVGMSPGRDAPGIPAQRPTTPVYALGATGTGPRLYREFRTLTGADPVRAAVAGLATAPADPDYRSPWLGVPARLTRSGSTATVTFTRAPVLAGATAQLAVQQVVYTVTAADPRIRTVRVVAPGLPETGALPRADQAGVLAPVWLLAPLDRGTAASRLTVSGTASVFEGTVAVEVRRGAQVLARTTATASAGAPGRGGWSATLSVPPGDYVVAAYEASQQDGSLLAEDTKRVTVSGR